MRFFILISLVFFSVSVRAASFTISDGQTVTSAQALDGDSQSGVIDSGGALNVSGADAISVGAHDNVSIVNNGEITVDGTSIAVVTSSSGDGFSLENGGTISSVSDNAVDLDGGSMTVVNSGSIVTTNDSADGIKLDTSSTATITNSGSITTSGVDSEGVRIDGGDVSVVNSGSIATSGEGAEAVFSSISSGVVSLVNSGSIVSSGDNAEPVQLSGGNSVSLVNDGSIIFNGGGNQEVVSLSGPTVSLVNNSLISLNGVADEVVLIAASDVAIVNNGAISSSADSVDNLFVNAVNSAVITNNGSIIASGVGSRAAYLNSANAASISFTNAGKLYATGNSGYAVLGVNGEQNLTLNQGSQIIGAVDLGDGTDSLTLAGNGVSGRVVTSNIENFSVNAGVAGVIVNGVVHSVDPTGVAMVGIGVNRLSLDIHDGAVEEDGLWVRGFGSSFERDAEGSNFAYESDRVGLRIGYNFDSVIDGFEFGFASGELKTKTDSFKFDVDSFFAGFHKNFELWKGGVLSGNFLAGYEKYKGKRTVVDNVSGVIAADSEFDNLFISPSLKIAHKIKFGERFDVVPHARVAYLHSVFGEYEESGANSNLTIDEREIEVLNSRIGLDGFVKVADYQLQLGAGFDNRAILEEGDVEARIDNTSFSFASNNNDNVSGTYVRVGLTTPELFGGVVVSASFEGRSADGGEDGYFGFVGGRVGF